jgi:hypothetical protein
MEYAHRADISAEEFQQHRDGLERWRDRLLAAPCESAAEVAVRNRLKKQRPHLLGCLHEPAAEPTNNRAERALRPAVIARKVSCGNKTRRGKQTWEKLTSLATTWRQRGQDVVDVLTKKLPLVPAR